MAPGLAVYGVAAATCIAAIAAIAGRLEQLPAVLMLLPAAGLLLGAVFLEHHQATAGLTLSGLSLGLLILLVTFQSGRADLETVASIGFAVAWLAFGVGRVASRQPLAGASDCLGSLAMAVYAAARV